MYTERIIEDIVFKVAIHELGHNLSLRHNFYGSIDAHHMHEGELSSSVMDYVWSVYEAGTRRGWGQYDAAALKWIYGTEDVREEMMAEDFLYCTDEHRFRSPLCRAHDLGITPSQITLNAIERYNWLYDIRNRRAYRTFWDTGRYNGQVMGSIYPLMRMWYLAIFDWGGGGVQDVLKRLDQVQRPDQVLTDQEYDEISIDFYNDISAAIDMTMAFYDAIINQPASLRNYQTEYDPYYGDIIRLGIVLDKLHAVFAFMDVTEVFDYSPNIYTYVAMYDVPFGTRNSALAQKVMDNMLGSSYDTFRWFRYLGINLFAWATNGNDIGSVGLKERIAIRRFENRSEFTEEYGEQALVDATAENNPGQFFTHEGEHIYTYLRPAGILQRGRNAVVIVMKECNESVPMRMAAGQPWPRFLAPRVPQRLRWILGMMRLLTCCMLAFDGLAIANPAEQDARDRSTSQSAEDTQLLHGRPPRALLAQTKIRPMTVSRVRIVRRRNVSGRSVEASGGFSVPRGRHSVPIRTRPSVCATESYLQDRPASITSTPGY